MSDNDTTAGRLRALEALVLEMGVTPQQIQAAQERIKEGVRRKDKQVADMIEKLGKPLDEHADEALEKLKWRLEREKRGL